ncbi:cellulose binding domain-containing protein [Micromonospora sp. NPDC002575]|uniref:cellulose binding domain-containing protein n=1 Tax=Micromonospora sp. NPDC002575 TaxID=3364222 RepID=UPI003685D797
MNRPRPRFRPGLLVLAGALLLAPVAPGLAPAATAAEAAGAAGAAAPPAVTPAWTPAPPTPSTTPMSPGPTPTSTSTAPHPTDSPTPTPTSSNPTDPPSPTPTTTLRCSATWRLVSDWPGAFHAEVTVRNTGTSPMARWAVRLTLPEGQDVRDIWNATISSTIDDVVTISNTGWNGRIGPGADAIFGLIGTGPAATPTLSCIAV